LLLKMTIACSGMAALLLYFTPGLEIWSGLSVVERLLYLGAIIGSAVVVYFGILWFSGIRPGKLKRA